VGVTGGFSKYLLLTHGFLLRQHFLGLNPVLMIHLILAGKKWFRIYIIF